MAQIERRLAAVMLADIAGYSALMEHAESRTYQRVRTMHEELVNPIVARYGGRIIKTTGDGFLAEFSSSTAALLCGIDIQRLNHAREATKDEAERFHLRIGINLGDIIIDGDDISGDGVNVAARLEPLAPNDGICVSGAVRDQIREDLDVVFEDLGEQQVKNISRPIRAYRISLTDAPLSKAVVRRKKSWLWLSAVAICGVVLVGGSLWYWSSHQTAKVKLSPSVPGDSGAAIAPGSPDAEIAPLSILVLPFANQTGEPQKSYIADALTTSITSDLSRIRDAFVVPSPTAFAYKDKPLTIKQVAADAAVRFVLQGSVMSAGDKLRISAQLIDAQTGAQLWSETFDGELTKLFALQDQVTTRIGNSIGPEMVIVAARDSVKRQSTPKVADLMLRVLALSLQPNTLDRLREQEKLLRQALKIDPNHADAIAVLAMVLITQQVQYPYEHDDAAQARLLDEADQLAVRGQKLDPQNPYIYNPLSSYLARKGDREGARRALERGLELLPKNKLYYINLGLSIYQHDPERAISLFKQGLALDPKHPGVTYNFISAAYFILGNYQEAIDWGIRCVNDQPTFAYCYEPLAWSYAIMGDQAKAKATVADLLRVAPSYRTSRAVVLSKYANEAERNAYQKEISAAKLAGIPE